MSFLEITPQQQTGIQVNSWINSLLSSARSAKSNYEQIMNWLEVSQDNPEYTEEDRQAVITKVNEAIVQIKSLLPNE